MDGELVRGKCGRMPWNVSGAIFEWFYTEKTMNIRGFYSFLENPFLPGFYSFLENPFL
jgi:hypothetical protein